jgi:hypothetical protein
MHGVNAAYLVLMTIAAEVPKLCKEKKNTSMSVQQPSNPNTWKFAGGGGLELLCLTLYKGLKVLNWSLKYDGFSQVLCCREGRSMCFYNTVATVWFLMSLILKGDDGWILPHISDLCHSNAVPLLNTLQGTCSLQPEVQQQMRQSFLSPTVWHPLLAQTVPLHGDPSKPANKRKHL